MNKLTAAWLNRETQERLGKPICDCTDEELEQVVRDWEAEFPNG